MSEAFLPVNVVGENKNCSNYVNAEYGNGLNQIVIKKEYLKSKNDILSEYNNALVQFSNLNFTERDRIYGTHIYSDAITISPEQFIEKTLQVNYPKAGEVWEGKNTGVKIVIVSVKDNGDCRYVSSCLTNMYVSSVYDIIGLYRKTDCKCESVKKFVKEWGEINGCVY